MNDSFIINDVPSSTLILTKSKSTPSLMLILYVLQSSILLHPTSLKTFLQFILGSITTYSKTQATVHVLGRCCFIVQCIYLLKALAPETLAGVGLSRAVSPPVLTPLNTDGATLPIRSKHIREKQMFKTK